MHHHEAIFWHSKGTLLATNRPVTTLYWQGTGNKGLTLNQVELIEKLETIIAPFYTNKLALTEKNGTQLLIAHDISFTQLSKIMEFFPNHPNLIISTHFKRFYPYQKIASHILGHLSTINSLESMGKMGLEKILHETLQGEQGKILKTINSIGTNIKQIEIKSPLAGHDIVTTIDLPLQLIAETIFPQEYSGTLLVYGS